MHHWCGAIAADNAVWPPPFANAQPTAADLEAGEQIYLKRCAHCHGVDGDGIGASTDVVYPKPRDFTSGVYKVPHPPRDRGRQLAGLRRRHRP